MKVKAATNQRRLWWRRPVAKATSDDAADFGTTFGLEMSLQEGPWPQSAAERPSRPRAWWRRLFGRRLPA